MIKITFFMAD